MEEEWVKELKEWCKKNSNSKLAGEEVSFPYADGNAYYMVFSEKPTKLIHLPIGDGWEYPYIERLSSKEIINKIESQNRVNKVLSKFT